MFLLDGVPSAFTGEISQENTNNICAPNYVEKSKNSFTKFPWLVREAVIREKKDFL